MSTPLVHLGNFEVEEQWARGEYGLPRPANGSGRAVVHRMDEFALLLGGAPDGVLLKTPPEDGYLAYLAGLGVALPRVLVPARQDPRRTVTEDVLADDGLRRELRALAATGSQLAPHGVSELEERLAEAAGIRLAAPPAAVCKRVNSKIYSRTVAAEERLRQPRGRVCRDLSAYDEACAFARRLLADGRPVVVKDAFGVSGKGIVVIREQRMLDRLSTMLHRRADHTGDHRVTLVVEEWVAKRCDLNYQFTISRGGQVRFDFVREALTADGVHKGHRMPVELAPAQLACLAAAAEALGPRLARDGYFGVVGVDALVEPDGGVHSVIEINARNNMSTYQERLRLDIIGPGRHALATVYPLQLREPVAFGQVRGLLGDLLYRRAGGTGVLVNNLATVNAAAADERRSHDGRFGGRLYAIVVAGSATQAAAMDREVGARLAAISPPAAGPR